MLEGNTSPTSDSSSIEQARTQSWTTQLVSRAVLGAKRGFRLFLYVGAIVLLWLLLNRFSLLERNFLQGSAMVLSVLLYLLSLPLSALFRLDQVVEVWSFSGRHDVVITIGMLFVLINFTLIGALLGLRGKREKKAAKKNEGGRKPLIVRHIGKTRTVRKL